MFLFLILIGFAYGELQSISSCKDGTMTTWVDANLQSITFGLGDLLVERGLNVGGTEKDAGDGNIHADGNIKAVGTITAKDVEAESITIGTPVPAEFGEEPWKTSLQSFANAHVYSNIRLQGDIQFSNLDSRIILNGEIGNKCELDTPKGFDKCLAHEYGGSISFNTQIKGQFAEDINNKVLSNAVVGIFGKKLYIQSQTYIKEGLHVGDEFTASDRKFQVDQDGSMVVAGDATIKKSVHIHELLQVEEGSKFNGIAKFGSYVVIEGSRMGPQLDKNFYYGIYFVSGQWTLGPSVSYNVDLKKMDRFDNRAISLHCRYGILAGGVMGLSDMRIKKDIVPVPDNHALSIIRKLDAKYYNYIDFVERGARRTVGFIAQHVKEHIPEAVSLKTGFIPSEMRIIEPKWLKLSDKVWSFKVEDLENGGRYKFLVGDESNSEEKIWKTEDDGKTFLTDKVYEKIFLYGKEIDDLHAIDKQKIFAVSYAALQQVDKNQQVLQKKVSDLEDTVAKLSKRLDALEAR